MAVVRVFHIGLSYLLVCETAIFERRDLFCCHNLVYGVLFYLLNRQSTVLILMVLNDLRWDNLITLANLSLLLWFFVSSWFNDQFLCRSLHCHKLYELSVDWFCRSHWLVLGSLHLHVADYHRRLNQDIFSLLLVLILSRNITMVDLVKNYLLTKWLTFLGYEQPMGTIVIFIFLTWRSFFWTFIWVEANMRLRLLRIRLNRMESHAASVMRRCLNHL